MRPEELAQAITELYEWARDNGRKPEEAELPRRLREHFASDLIGLEVVSEELSSYDHVNLQVALDAFAADAEAIMEVIGLSVERGFRPRLAEVAQGVDEYGGGAAVGPVEYVRVDVGDRTVSCITAGLLLIREADDRMAVLVAPADEDGGLVLDALATRRAYAEKWFARIRRLMHERNVYRGKVVSFGGGRPFEPRPLHVRRLPDVARERIVLPAGVLERVERHTAGLARHRDALRAAGRHIKRGVLLHGPPGTGKTLTIMYLAGLMPDRTVVLLTGASLGGVEAACQLARSLEPAMVVLEDVDLVALERSHFTGNAVLFELLNAMDGLDEDADLIFALTTNRPELLEPALAQRPGRIDLAVELPLPDAPARRRLLAIYADGLDLAVADWAPIVEATDGTSPAFIREVMRQAALTAAERGGRHGPLEGDDVLAAVQELKTGSGRLTASLLGAEPPPDIEPFDPDGELELLDLQEGDYYDGDE